ncbi:hypothetical protein BD410DRAFT_834288 [Rickenella mellea]|uniref:Uncharacterized protein n=1 Tax=Rickenella mellea TaxID=50990 RepID=A0A4R5XHH3_9AGAM|nr:hypothetical protein BD410DRAFT_834288 [Rickenella mellea]
MAKTTNDSNKEVKDRDVEENKQIDNGANSNPTDMKHAIEVWVSIAIAVVAIASQFALFEASSITGNIAHVLFLSAVLLGMTATFIYATEYGRNTDGDGVYRSVMICSMSGVWCFVFGLLSMTWAIRSISVAACVTAVFCFCLGLVVLRKIHSIKRIG